MAILLWFEARPDVRVLAGLVFLTLLAWLYFRISQGSGRFVFVLIVLALGVVFILSPLAQLLSFVPLLALVGIQLLRLAGRRRTRYEPAVAMVESGAVKRGLTAPEAAVLMELPLGTVIATVLLGLIRKGMLEVVEMEPLTLQLAGPFQTDTSGLELAARTAARRRAAQETKVLLHAYEEPFLAVFEGSAGPLEHLNVSAAVRALLRHSARQVRGHRIEDTQDYYRKHLGRARHDVELAGQAGPAERAYDRNFDWLLLDSRYAELYGEYLEKWLAERGFAGESPQAWLKKLRTAAARTVPAGSLSVRTADGQRLSIGRDDPISMAYFEAVIGGIR